MKLFFILLLNCSMVVSYAQTAFDYFKQGSDYLKSEKYLEAIGAFENSARIEPSEFTYSSLGLTYIQLKKYQDAINCFQIVLKVNPNSAEAYFSLGLAYIGLEETQNAIDAFVNSVRIKRDEVAYRYLGQLYHKLGKYQDAVHCYQAAIDIKPYNINGYRGLGVNNYKEGNYKEAVNAYSKVAALEPNDDSIFRTLGIALDNLGRYQEAIWSFDKSIAIDSTVARTYSLKGQSCDNLGKYQEAVDCFRKSIELMPAKSTKIRLMRSLVRLSQKEEKKIGTRLAVVIGNTKYDRISIQVTECLTQLDEAVKNAKNISDALKKLKFKVFSRFNLNYNDMKQFVDSINVIAKGYDIVLFYFAGHGFQDSKAFFLLPTDYCKNKEKNKVNANEILHKMNDAQCNLKVMVLDACRESSEIVSMEDEITFFNNENDMGGTLIAFSAIDNTKASGNDKYTNALVSALEKDSHLDIEDLFREVGTKVRTDSEGKYIPIIYSGITIYRFYFK